MSILLNERPKNAFNFLNSKPERFDVYFVFKNKGQLKKNNEEKKNALLPNAQ